MRRPLEFYVGAVFVVTSGYGIRTAWYACTLMVWSNNSHDGPRTGIFNVFHVLRGRAGPARVPYGQVRESTKPESAKIPHGRRIWPYGTRTGPLRSPHGLFTGWLQSQNPYEGRKFIMHALKLYGSRTGRQNEYGAVRGPCWSREWTYDFCSKQPGTAREQPVRARECDMTGALLWNAMLSIL